MVITFYIAESPFTLDPIESLQNLPWIFEKLPMAQLGFTFALGVPSLQASAGILRMSVDFMQKHTGVSNPLCHQNVPCDGRQSYGLCIYSSNSLI